MGKSDVSFSFDAEGFQTAINNMTAGINNLEKKFTEYSNNSAKNISKGVVSGLTKFSLLATGAVKAFQFIAKSLLNVIPEIGEVFNVASGIIMRNFLWPLRKALLPILQGILDWARKNRKTFAEWGTVLVSVFRTVKTVFQGIISLLSPLINEIKKILKSIFGDTSKSITETINVALFKISSFIIGLQAILQPVFDALAGVFGKILIGIKSFVAGFVEGFKKMFTSSNFDFKLMESLVNLLSKLSILLEKLTPALKIFGEILGVVVAGSLRIVIDLLTETINLISDLFEILANPDKWKSILTSMGKRMLALGFQQTKTFADMGKGLAGAFKSPELKKAQDVIITKKGEIIQTSPEDNIVASKSMGKSIKLEINMGQINLNVTEGSAKQAGVNYIDGMKRQIRNILLNEIVLEGGI